MYKQTLKHDLTGHNAQFKVGNISSANIEGDAVNIAGHIFCSDFPREALRIQLNKADLGFSFEAANISVSSMQDDPLTITGLHFTGAAILLRDQAAYATTALAAAKEVTITVHPRLFHRLRQCGFTRCGDPANRLSFRQFDAVLADRSVADRIELKHMIAQAGIWPNGGS